MKVLYDSKIFQMQKFGGISRYFYKIIKNRNNSFDYHISGLYSDNIYLKELNKVKEFPIKRQFKGKGRIISLINNTDFYQYHHLNQGCDFVEKQI